MVVAERARLHAALGDPHRLQMIDELLSGDRTFQELARLVGLPGNAAAHHLLVLEAAGLIERRQSEGDRRRRYVTLRRALLDTLSPPTRAAPESVLFVCTHNSARSQFAAALWRQGSRGSADSAGTVPARRIHPMAARVAAEFGLDLSEAVPKGFDRISVVPDLVISVCDRARETVLPPAPRYLHWSVPDPVRVGTLGAFRAAFADIAGRVTALAESAQH
jgi:protein-tyrosine-phosphatase/DNA-binding transcriptional ArsR family regulator